MNASQKTSRFRAWRVAAGLVCIALCWAAVSGAAPLFGGQKEKLTLNTSSYEVVIQKNGRVDVRTIGGSTLFDNVGPAVVFAEAEGPETLPVDWRYTARTLVENPLGSGNGMQFVRKQCEWLIQTYPTRPFLTVRVSFVNTGKKPVRVAKLIPWSVGTGRNGAVTLGSGAENTRILENGRLFSKFNDYALVSKDKAASQWNFAAYNPGARQGFVAGFITHERGYGELVMARSEDAPPDGFDRFRAECVFDPPVEVPPAGRLSSEVFYLAVAEADLHEGLERLARAMAAVNGALNRPPFMPHGWDSWSTRYGRGITEARILENLDFVDTHLKRYGWTHLAIDAGWERGPADWEAHPERFPHGMKAMADAIHERGMTAGIWFDPFTVPHDSELAKAHPEWLAEPHALGRMLLGGDKKILDVTVPEACDYVRGLAAKIGNEWGFDALMEADFVYHLLLAETYHEPNVTRIEVQRRGMAALREGFGGGKFIMSMTPQPVNALYSDGIRVGRDCAPVWRARHLEQSWGCVDTLTNAARRYYFAPWLYVPDQDCAFFGHEASRKRWKCEDAPPLTWEQSVAWLTGAALTGGVVKVGEPFVDLSEREVAVLRKLLPSPGRPARPVDLFQEGAPQIWWLPLEEDAGKWDIVAVFNWAADEADEVMLNFADFDLPPDAYYTVYDFWAEQYYGTARETLQTAVAPGSVRLLGLRRHRDRPMLLATDRHYTQGALDHTSLFWDPDTRILQGEFDAVEDTDYALRVLVPEPYEPGAAEVASLGGKEDRAEALTARTAMDARVLVLSFHCGRSGGVRWRVRF